MLLSEALHLFESEYIAMRGLSASAEENYQIAVLSFQRSQGNIRLKDITPHHILQWRRDMEKKNKPGTIRCHMSKLKNILLFTNKRGLTSFDISEIYLPKIPPALPKYLTEEEIEQLYEAATTLRDKCIILLMFTSGVRCGELVRLNRSDIHEKALFIRRGKGNTTRVVFMSERTRHHIEKYLQSRQDRSDVLFISYRHKALDSATITKILKPIAKSAGVNKPVHAHVMRHSCATHMVKNGVDTSFVQKQLGHAFISTTQIYVHLTEVDLLKAHEKAFA